MAHYMELWDVNDIIIIRESTFEDIKDIQKLWADEDVMKYIWLGD